MLKRRRRKSKRTRTGIKRNVWSYIVLFPSQPNQIQVCTPFQFAVTNHWKQSGFQAHWESLVTLPSSATSFGTQLQMVRALGSEKAVTLHWSLGHFGMSVSSPELEHWISEHWQLLLNNEGFVIRMGTNKSATCRCWIM